MFITLVNILLEGEVMDKKESELNQLYNEIRELIDKEKENIQRELNKRILMLYWDVYLKIIEFEKSKENV